MQIGDSAVLKRYSTHWRMHQAVRRAMQHLHSSSRRKSRYSHVSAAAGPGNKSAVRTDSVTCGFLFTGQFWRNSDFSCVYWATHIQPKAINCLSQIVLEGNYFNRTLPERFEHVGLPAVHLQNINSDYWKRVHENYQHIRADSSGWVQYIWCSTPSKWQHVYFV